MNDEIIVKIKKSDLQALIDANTEAYNLLDEASTFASNAAENVKRAFSILEDVPLEINDIIVEDEE